ncbi:MAG TPA: hypothetical protein VHP37_33480 [Burkholderiales bacterium]|nr:hypothetical protein [Burkholderiales bacterium]
MNRPAFAIAALLAATAAGAQAPSYSTLTLPDFRQPFPVKTLATGEKCADCGRVQSVREVATERKAAVPTTFQGSSRGIGETHLVGAVLYLPLSTRADDKPFLGGVGTPEMRQRFGESTYAVTVKLDDATTRVVHRPDGSRFNVGDRVRILGANDMELVVD